MTERPKCRRCGRPLDLWHDEDGWELTCALSTPPATDEQFWAAWDNLPGDDVARLIKVIEKRAERPPAPN